MELNRLLIMSKKQHCEVEAIGITDSYKYSKYEFDKLLDDLKLLYPDSPVWNRTYTSLKAEWATHNLLYNLHLFRVSTKDVTLDYPQKFYMRILYYFFGAIAWIFIK